MSAESGRFFTKFTKSAVLYPGFCRGFTYFTKKGAEMTTFYQKKMQK